MSQIFYSKTQTFGRYQKHKNVYTDDRYVNLVLFIQVKREFEIELMCIEIREQNFLKIFNLFFK